MKLTPKDKENNGLFFLKTDFHTVKLQLDLPSVAQQFMKLPKEMDSNAQATRVVET